MYSLLRAGLLAHDADADARTAACAGTCRCRSPPPTTSCRRVDDGRRSAACPASATAAPTASATSSARRASGGVVPRVQAADRGHAAATRPTGTTSRRTSASPGGRTCRTASCARCSAIRSRRRSAAATRSPTSGRAWAIFTGIYGANPGSTLSLTPRREHRQLVPARRDVAGALQPDGPAVQRAVPGDADVPDRDPAESRRRPQRVRARHQDRRRRSTWTVSFQRSITRDMAVDIRYVGTRGCEPVVGARTTTHPRREPRSTTGSSTSSRSRWTTCTANNAVGRREPRRIVRLLRAGHRHEPAADLPGLPERQPATPTTRRPTPATTPGRTPRSRRTSSAPNPSPVNSAADLDGNVTRRDQRDRGGSAGELLRRSTRTSTT